MDGRDDGQPMDFTEIVLTAAKLRERIEEKITITARKTPQLVEDSDG